MKPRQNAELNAAVIIEEVNAVVINPQIESLVHQPAHLPGRKTLRAPHGSPRGFARNLGRAVGFSISLETNSLHALAAFVLVIQLVPHGRQKRFATRQAVQVWFAGEPHEPNG